MMYDSMHKGSQSLIVERGIALHKMARLATLCTAGHGYMNFIGNEFGHPEWIDFPREGNDWSYTKARRQWSLRNDAALRFQGLAEFDQALMAIPEPLWATQPAELVKADDGDHVLAFRRGSYLIVCNFHPEKSYAEYGIPASQGEYECICHTDDVRYGGFGREQSMVKHTDGEWLRFYLPARTASIWKHKN
jgi:1,4-alpha-glucan branching enzyme